MNLITYIENRFQECTYEGQISDQYDIVNDAEIKALHQILTTYRVVLKWLLVPRVFVNFLMVATGLKTAPTPVILNKMKADKAAQQESKKPGTPTLVNETAQTPA